MKKIVKLTENDLHRIVENAVKRILKEDIGAANMLPNGLPDDLSDEQYVQAWENMWKTWMEWGYPGLATQVYYAYKNNPAKIKDWYIRRAGTNSMPTTKGDKLDPHDYL